MTLKIERTAMTTRLARDLLLLCKTMAQAEQRSLNSIVNLLLQRWVAGEIEARPPRNQTGKEPKDDDDDSN